MANNKGLTEYLTKLKDPRWQKKRLEIFERDNWACQKCRTTKITLVVHHRLYLHDTEPWDYPNDLLITFCEDCHELEAMNMASVEKDILAILKTKFLAEGIHEIRVGLHQLELLNDEATVGAVYGWALSDTGIQRELTTRYYQYIEELTRKVTNKDKSR